MNLLQKETEAELTGNILPYWMDKMVDRKYGGFYGRIDGEERRDPYANKGSILNARILWTFSAAYRKYGSPEYLDMALRARDFLTGHFLDKRHGGIYWETDYRGRVVNSKKQTYAQGFALYGFSEFYRATGDPESLEIARDLFRLIEEKSGDTLLGGYLEAFNEDWSPIEDMRLSARDANAPKTMNTHLHILEPYTNLLQVWDDPELRRRQTGLIRIFTERIVSPRTNHLGLFFDREWRPTHRIVSYGHDIEAAWLLIEAAEVAGDNHLLAEIRERAVRIAEAACEGIAEDGSMIYESDPAHTDRNRHWWVQAEAVTGFCHIYRITRDPVWLERAERCWKYIREHLIDRKNGEWHWSVQPDGTPDRSEDKAGFWKCPYHNARMCLQITDTLQSTNGNERV